MELPISLVEAYWFGLIQFQCCCHFQEWALSPKHNLAKLPHKLLAAVAVRAKVAAVAIASPVKKQQPAVDVHELPVGVALLRRTILL
jgi:hypothetical protein